jgi:hypothetical protein
LRLIPIGGSFLASGFCHGFPGLVNLVIVGQAMLIQELEEFFTGFQ